VRRATSGRACSKLAVIDDKNTGTQGTDTNNPVQNVTFAFGGGTAHGYLALPPSGRGPGVVVIQEWWGLTTHIKDVTDRLAAEGFVALTPDLFGGTTTHDSDEAGTLMQGAARRPGFRS
jgi:dienelactone hydrolase